MDRPTGPSVRFKLALSYAGFLMLAGIILLIFLAVYGKSLTRSPNRYRPGKAWDFEPSWYVPHPEVIAGTTAKYREAYERITGRKLD